MPLCIDLFCGLGRWSEGFLSEGWDVIGFDIERHVYGDQHYPAQLVLQDVLTLHGSQFRNANCIVASPPCQEFSYMAMPWSRAKQIAKALRGSGEFPEGYTGSRSLAELTALFDACFRIQQEACEAAGRHIPMVVENVKGAQPWVGPAKANFGSFYFWGDVAMVGGRVVAGVPQFGRTVKPMHVGRKNGGNGTWFAISHGIDNGQTYGANPVRGEGIDGRKGPGGDWFENGRQGQDACAAGLKTENHANIRDGHTHTRHLTNTRESREADLLKFAAERYPEDLDGALKVPGISFSGYGEPGYKPQGFNVTAAQRYREKNGGDGTKQGGDWFGDSSPGSLRNYSSRSDSRKAASAQIAKIPFPLASYIARSFKPPALPATSR